MARILTIGIATLDIINLVDHYPQEDEEMRVLSQSQTRGGNASNTAVVLSQLGHSCDWAGVLIQETDVEKITADFDHYDIGYQQAQWLEVGKMPTSYIMLNQQTGSRTILHYRDCPELSFAHFQQLAFASYDWIHFEGRNIAELSLMLDWLQRHHPTIPRSLEIEKPRDGLEALFDFADLLMFSRPYVKACGFNEPTAFLQQLGDKSTASCSWGQHGAWLKQAGKILHQPAVLPKILVDTLGAGDTFNAALISAFVKKHAAELALKQACTLAGYKCGQRGFANLSSVTLPL